MFNSIIEAFGIEEECWPCRLVSGFGLMGCGAYVEKYAKIQKSALGRNSMRFIALGFGAVGVARLLDLPPFRKDTKMSSD